MAVRTKIKGYIGAIKNFIVRHKVWSAIIVLGLVGAGWWATSALATNTNNQTRYVLGGVATGTIVASVSESGQITSTDTLNIQPQVSGQITYIAVKPGEQVRAGQVIAQLNSTTAQQAVQSAKENLQSAQLALQKLQEPSTALTLTQQQDSITQAQQALASLYQSTFGDITNTFLDLPTIIAGLQDINLGSEAGGASQWNMDYYTTQASQYSPQASSYRTIAYNDYLAARQSYDQTLSDFKAVSSTPDPQTIENLLKETDVTTGLLATAVTSSNNLLGFYTDQLTKNGATPKPVSATQIASLNSYQSKAQSHLTTLLSDSNTLVTDKNNITVTQQTLQQTQAGADPIDVESSQLSITKAQEALQQAENTLAEYYITAPFSGVIGSVPVHVYDQAGSGTTLATLITTKQYVDLQVNEVDAAKIQLGDETTLTFDAISGLTLTGVVAQINPTGTVSQGVVTYDVQVGFDSQDPRIKAGMTTSAAIITAAHQNVLTVPSGAVKTTQAAATYVLVFTPPLANTGSTQGVLSSVAPQQVPVVAGLTDNTNTEIVSGLTAGEQIVVRTTTGQTTASAAAVSTSRTGFGGGGARTIGL